MCSVGTFGSRRFGSTFNTVQANTGDKKTSRLMLKDYPLLGAIAECSV